MNWLYQASYKFPGKIAVKEGDTSLTYKELFEVSYHLSQKINHLGKKRIAVYISNSLNSVILIHAMIQAQVEIVFIHTRLTEHEINAQLKDIGVETILTTMNINISYLQVISFEELKHSEGTEVGVREPEDSEVLSIMFTSGTTGKPKAAAQTYLNHYASAVGCEARLGYDETARWLLVNPIYHISGLSIVFRTVISGATLIIANKFEEDDIIHLFEREKITHTSLVPVMLQRLLTKEWNHQLQSILLGGAGMTRDLIQKAIDRSLPIYNSFGMTETCSQIVSVSYNDHKILSSTVGKPQPNVDIKIDTQGELLVRSDSVIPYYLNADISMEDGYFKTGDLAEIDEEGYLYILDRRKDLIISGGENIYPKEIEDYVMSIKGIDQCVVIKKTDEKWGEVPVLLVEGTAEPASIRSFLNQMLARYKMPKEIHFVNEVFMTSTGKVSRTQNKKWYDKYINSKSEESL